MQSDAPLVAPPATPALCGNAPLCESATILAFSVVVFLFWDGPLWSAPAGASHFWRITISYLVVIPAVLAVQVWARRFDLRATASAVGLLWAIKMVITSTLYTLLAAPGDRYQPERAWESPATPVAAPHAAPYAASAGRVDLGDLSGTAAPFAVVVVEEPPAGLPAPAASDLAWTLRDSRHDREVRLAHPGDHIAIRSEDTVLHTLRIAGKGRALANVPVLAGVPRVIDAPEPGVYELSCENHPRETATLVVVDHPYAVVSDAGGHFEIHGIPAGRRTLAVYAAGSAPSHRTVEVSVRR